MNIEWYVARWGEGHAPLRCRRPGCPNIVIDEDRRVHYCPEHRDPALLNRLAARRYRLRRKGR